MAVETTVVKQCTCKNDGQDKIYGLFNRLFNLTDKDSYRCTVCGANFNVARKGK